MTRIVLALALLIACGRDERPNVVLVTLDTTRADRLGAMGWAAARTPVIDAIAARGVVYERAYAQVPLTLPSHATMLTGLDPSKHRVHDNGRFALPPDVPTVAERLRDTGYDTAAFVAAFVLDSSFGLDRGFARYDDDVVVLRDPMRHDVPRRPAMEVTDRAVAWLGERRTAPVFLWVHYYDVHLPRRPPAPYDAMTDPYDGALASVDVQVGRVLDAVAQASRRPTLTIVVGDHGEGLGEHDEQTHGFLVYDSTLHVPLVVAGPGFPAGVRSRRLAGTPDVAPTILAAAGLPALAGGSGRALATRLAPNDADDATIAFECFGGAYRLGWARLGGVRTSRWKLTAEPEPIELFDTLADPGETENRAATEPAVVADLRARWTATRSAAEEPAPPARATARIEEQLAALGYVDVAPAAPAVVAPDPRRYIAALQLIELAQTRAGEGAVGAAVAALEALATSPIVRPMALSALAQIHLANDRPTEAVEAAEALIELTGSFDAKLALARARLDAGDAAGALAVLDGAATAGGTSRRAQQLRVLVLLELGRTAEAVGDAEPLLVLEPGDPGAIALVARARSARDGAEVEIPRLEAVLASSKDAATASEIRGVLAGLLRQAGRDTDAVRVLEAVPSPPAELRVMLAEIASDHGNRAKAATLIESVVRDQPGVLRHRRQLADLYGELGRQADALAQYDALVVADPTDATLLVDRGVTKAALGQPREAEADYRAALALDEGIVEAHFNLALAELADGRDAGAEIHLLRTVELRPDHRKAHFHLARLYGRRQDPRGRRHAELAAGSIPGDSSPESR